jgi:thiamine monophosphate kinase
LADLALVAGRLLARGHARSGDALVIASYIGSSDRAIRALTKYAEMGTEINMRDFKAFGNAIKRGVFKVADNAS